MCHSGDKKKKNRNKNAQTSFKYDNACKIRRLSTNLNPGYLFKVCLCCIFNYQAVVAPLSPIFTAWLFKPYSFKIKNKTEKKYYHTLGTFPNANRKILLIDKIDISNTHRISPGTPVSPPIKLTTTI